MPLFLSQWIASVMRFAICKLTHYRHRMTYSKAVCDIAEQPYVYVLVQSQVGGQKIWLAHHPELYGCQTDGRTPAEAAWMLDDARHLWIEHCLKHSVTIPKPSGDYDAIHDNGLIIHIQPGYETWQSPDTETVTSGAGVSCYATCNGKPLNVNVVHHPILK